VKDRTYFRSIYFTDPDGLVFEFATSGPGFDVDEDDPGATEIDPFEDEDESEGA
jgi:glyoxalase family protein